MSKSFKAVGISFKNTPLEVREAVAFSESQAKTFMRQLSDLLNIEEVMVLSTCNRTEIYFLSEEENIANQVCAFVDVFHGLTDSPSAAYFNHYDHDQALSHLFDVAIGLDSAVLGDIQISNQVKKAYQWCADEQMAGPFVHRLLHTIFFTNKRVVQETNFKDGTASLASASVDLVQQFAQNYTMPKVAVIGLGEIGANVAENLRDLELSVTLVNRTLEKAKNLAQSLNFGVSPLSNLPKILEDHHIVISAAQVSEPLITSAVLGANVHPRLFIDLSVPRSISPDVELLAGAILYNVDQLTEKTSKALASREAAIPQVREILRNSISEFSNWSQEMEVSPAIKRFKMALEDIRKSELARYLDKLDGPEAEILDKATKNIIQKVVQLPVLQLKAACKRGEAESLIGVLNDLFNLEKDASSVKKPD